MAKSKPRFQSSENLWLLIRSVELDPLLQLLANFLYQNIYSSNHKRWNPPLIVNDRNVPRVYCDIKLTTIILHVLCTKETIQKVRPFLWITITAASSSRYFAQSRSICVFAYCRIVFVAFCDVGTIISSFSYRLFFFFKWYKLNKWVNVC